MFLYQEKMSHIVHVTCATSQEQHKLDFQALHSTNLKKEKDFFFSFRFKTILHSPRHISRMSGALCDFDER
jgi:hypothetical protein